MLNVYFINVLMSLLVLENMLRELATLIQRMCTPFKPATCSVKMYNEYNGRYEVVNGSTAISSSYDPLKLDEGMSVWCGLGLCERRGSLTLMRIQKL